LALIPSTRFREHGRPRASLEAAIGEARETMENLARAGVPWRIVTARLTTEGVQLFEEAFDQLLEAFENRAKKAS